MMETVWKHHRTLPRNNKSIKPMNLWNISFQTQIATAFNAANQNNYKTIQILSLYFFADHH